MLTLRMEIKFWAHSAVNIPKSFYRQHYLMHSQNIWKLLCLVSDRWNKFIWHLFCAIVNYIQLQFYEIFRFNSPHLPNRHHVTSVTALNTIQLYTCSINYTDILRYAFVTANWTTSKRFSKNIYTQCLCTHNVGIHRSCNTVRTGLRFDT